MSSQRRPTAPQPPPVPLIPNLQLPLSLLPSGNSSPSKPLVIPQASADHTPKFFTFLKNVPGCPTSRSRSPTIDSYQQPEQYLRSPVIPTTQTETMLSSLLKPRLPATNESSPAPGGEVGFPSREPTPERFYARPVGEHHLIVRNSSRAGTFIDGINLLQGDGNLDQASSSSDSSTSPYTAKPAIIKHSQEEKIVHERADLVEISRFKASKENTPPLTSASGHTELAPASPLLLPLRGSLMQMPVDYPSRMRLHDPYFERAAFPPPIPQYQFQPQHEHKYVRDQSHHLPHYRPQSKHLPKQHWYSQAHPQVQTQVPDIYVTDEREQHIQLRIRVAVLENELKHKEQENFNILESLGLVSRGLPLLGNGNTYAYHGGAERRGEQTQDTMHERKEFAKIKNLEQEIEDLRRENRGLRERMRRADESLGQTEEVRRRDADIRKYTEKISHPTTRTWEQGFWGFDNSAEEASDESAKVKEQEGKLLDATVNAKPYQQLYPESLNMEVWERHQQGNGSNIEGPTVPDSGIQQAKDKYDDIGILSLEDVLGSENGDTSQYSSFLPSSRGKRKEIEVTNKQHRKYSQEGDEKTTDEHTAYHLTAMQNYTNTPAPKVQQVGFTTTNCIRGKEYRVRAAERASRQHISEVRETSMLPLNPGAFKIWDSEEQKEIVIDQQVRGAGKGGLRFPDMFRHGLMYLPEGDGVGSKRTVVVGNLPRDIELWELFRKVRGGMVVSAVLVDSIALTGAKSALVQFVSGFDAKRYIEFVSEHPLFFGDEDEKVKTSFTLINTPTWPIGPGLAKAIFDIDLKYTRCLIVPCFPPNLSLTTLEATLRGSKGVHHDSLVDMYFDRKRNLHLEFSSVVAAGRARGLLGAWFRYRSLTIENEADPCAGELEELLIEFMPRRPLFPHEGFLDWAMEEDFPFAINTRQIDAPFADSSYVHRMDIVDLQGKRMAALDNQTVKIPSFSGKGSSSSNWADEVNEEPPPPSDTKISPFSILHPQEVPPNTPIPIRQVVDMIMADNINEKMKEVALVGGIRANFRKPPVGLAASKYVCLVPGFGDKRRDRSRTTEVKEFFIERKMVGSQAKEMRGAQNPDEIELDPE